MFAGEGDAFRTNRRFKLVSKACRQAPVHRVRLGHAVRRRPARAPDIYGKVGNSGVSIATLDDMKVLYDGFDLCNRPRRCR
jgi:methylmalonyl-CoA mutase